MKCLHPLGMSCGSCKLDARVYTTTTSEVSEQWLSPIAQLEIYKKGIAWENARIINLLEEHPLFIDITDSPVCWKCHDDDAGWDKHILALIKGGSQKDNETVVFLPEEQNYPWNEYLRLMPPDEHGMAYLTLDIETETHSAKQVEGKVVYDLDEAGNVIGVEFLFAPKNWLIKGEQK